MKKNKNDAIPGKIVTKYDCFEKYSVNLQVSAAIGLWRY